MKLIPSNMGIQSLLYIPTYPYQSWQPCLPFASADARQSAAKQQLRESSTHKRL